MSERSWNRGLDDAANGESARQRQDEDYYAGYIYGTRPPLVEPGPQQPDPPLQQVDPAQEATLGPARASSSP